MKPCSKPISSKDVVKALLAALFFFASPPSNGKDVPSGRPPPLRCELRRNGEGPGEEKRIDFGAASRSAHFILMSDRDNLKVYGELNSWGYPSRFFSAVDSKNSSRTYSIVKRDLAWSENVLSLHTLNRGRFLVTDIDFCDGAWKAVPKLPQGPWVELRVTPHFRIKKDADAVKSGVWTGEIRGAPKEIVIEKNCVERLNADN